MREKEKQKDDSYFYFLITCIDHNLYFVWAAFPLGFFGLSLFHSFVSSSKMRPEPLRQQLSIKQTCRTDRTVEVNCAESLYCLVMAKAVRNAAPGTRRNHAPLSPAYRWQRKRRGVWSFPRLCCHGKGGREYERKDVSHVMALSLRFREQANFNSWYRFRFKSWGQ